MKVLEFNFGLLQSTLSKEGTCLNYDAAKQAISQWKESFPNICGLHLLLFFWLKWAGYLAVAGLNLLAQISDRISPYGV